MDGISTVALSLPFVMTYFASLEIDYQAMNALNQPLFTIIVKIITMRYPEQEAFLVSIGLYQYNPVHANQTRELWFLPFLMLDNLILITTAVLMSIASIWQLKFGRDIVLTYITAVAARFLLLELSFWLIYGFPFDWLAFLTNPVAMFFAEACVQYLRCYCLLCRLCTLKSRVSSNSSSYECAFGRFLQLNLSLYDTTYLKYDSYSTVYHRVLNIH